MHFFSQVRIRAVQAKVCGVGGAQDAAAQDVGRAQPGAEAVDQGHVGRQSGGNYSAYRIL